MKLPRAAFAVCCTAVMCAALAPGAKSADWSKRFVHAIAVPVKISAGRLLVWSALPGAYVYTELHSRTDSQTVQSSDQRQMTIYAPISDTSTNRSDAADRAVITFIHEPAAEPVVLRTWYELGTDWGEKTCSSTAMLRHKAQWLSWDTCL